MTRPGTTPEIDGLCLQLEKTVVLYYRHSLSTVPDKLTFIPELYSISCYCLHVSLHFKVLKGEEIVGSQFENTPQNAPMHEMR